LLTLLFPRPRLTEPTVMGCSVSTPLDPSGKTALKQNAIIDKMIRMDKRKYDRTIKILLLGMPCAYFPAFRHVRRIDILTF
jgi:hypothetical protein